MRGRPARFSQNLRAGRPQIKGLNPKIPREVLSRNHWNKHVFRGDCPNARLSAPGPNPAVIASHIDGKTRELFFFSQNSRPCRRRHAHREQRVTQLVRVCLSPLLDEFEGDLSDDIVIDVPFIAVDAFGSAFVQID